MERRKTAGEGPWPPWSPEGGWILGAPEEETPMNKCPTCGATTSSCPTCGAAYSADSTLPPHLAARLAMLSEVSNRTAKDILAVYASGAGVFVRVAKEPEPLGPPWGHEYQAAYASRVGLVVEPERALAIPGFCDIMAVRFAGGEPVLMWLHNLTVLSDEDLLAAIGRGKHD